MGLFSSSKATSNVTNTDKRTAADGGSIAVNTSGNVSLVDGGAFGLVDKLIDKVGNLAEDSQKNAVGLIQSANSNNLETLKAANPHDGVGSNTIIAAALAVGAIIWVISK